MQLFINECSFREQFLAYEQLQSAVTRFLELVDTARKIAPQRRGRMWRSENLANAKAMRDETLHESLNHIAGRELFDQFKIIVYDRANPAPWEPERVHSSDDVYIWHDKPDTSRDIIEKGEGELVTETSMAELAARSLQDTTLFGCLLNIEGSSLDRAGAVDVFKVDGHWLSLPSTSTKDDFELWLRKVVVDVPPYAPEATKPPRDAQTCLCDPTRFKSTGKTYDDRIIYQHITNKQLYYVDNGHFGLAAHIEVFDKFGKKHVGKASLDGELQPSTRDTTKKALNL